MEAAPDVAGGRVTSTLANGKFSETVFGCTCKKTTGGVYDITLSSPIDITRQRVWVQNMGANIPWCAAVNQVSPTHITILTYLIIFDPTPPGAVALQLENYPITFGVSEIPS
jgi:hypothetical protein